ncbi:folylpolyglutamate synthase/dihydrofolate synthase family protein [Fulvivirga kasyanovii]|uniref:Dihydrofolate synthase/folylpolyglutamate synthase n=1 Tax=Fulvivirga kasyanovii TaxID=396812 RepID=A0ABW9RU52_9BACT|nr:folylpolyglutamate synthase/dihydrofolate synthase family protein [Fulvivirga kasyanovii]MTI27744.1 bifunctional folylpolyglutamate synthase/dihydrofolate synthase [Fulvivirga kasyanovii]
MSDINKYSQTYFSSYQEVLDYMYTQLPMFQRVGGAAFKKDLTNTLALCKYLSYPEHQFKSIHIAGTNGKGSSSNYLAAILQSAGYKTGLYTSPHLKNFTERIKVNGKEIPEDRVIDFMNRVRPFIEEHHPSFFELTVGMAFDCFAVEKVDIAVVEVGMGGRLDSTNVIIPEVSLITNISADHMQWLGNTLEEVAAEKGGIIKDHVPVVISEKQPGISEVFERIAEERQASLYFAGNSYTSRFDSSGDLVVFSGDSKLHTFNVQPAGYYQTKNIPGVLKVIDILRERGFEIADEHIIKGIENVRAITGLKGRWHVLGTQPMVVCDVGHNKAGVELILDQIASTPHKDLYMVWGAVNDKDITDTLALLPKEAHYFFCQANIPRALDAEKLYEEATKQGLKGRIIKNVNEAIAEAKALAGKDDLIFIGGSTFVVAEIADL